MSSQETWDCEEDGEDEDGDGEDDGDGDVMTLVMMRIMVMEVMMKVMCCCYRQQDGSVRSLHRGLQVRGECQKGQTSCGGVISCLSEDKQRCVFQVCARPQYGKWISCVTTDSDWMVRKRFLASL